jgi:hypothetical protein
LLKVGIANRSALPPRAASRKFGESLVVVTVFRLDAVTIGADQPGTRTPLMT